jgi:hypothetical protein
VAEEHSLHRTGQEVGCTGGMGGIDSPNPHSDSKKEKERKSN